MAVLDPTGDWLGWGAWALENSCTAMGEHSLDKRHTLLSDLESRGVNSKSFSQLKGKGLVCETAINKLMHGTYPLLGNREGKHSMSQERGEGWNPIARGTPREPDF
ncbi:hypothetical protein HAX54_044455 [Datura stramonium]|uniref:DUF8018 domain-containing protein n=1 Tax=Datura stramonium TaxID=4076 RepID=A0ABS8WEM8_DATST|nr:hypothetical protein [Datura stramonium]